MEFLIETRDCEQVKGFEDRMRVDPEGWPLTAIEDFLFLDPPSLLASRT